MTALRLVTALPSPAPEQATTPEARLELAARLWGWEPHPGQRAFLTLRLADGTEPKVMVAACGRRWGKTEALGCDIATRILTEPDLGQMGVAPTRDQAEGLYESVEEKLRDLLDLARGDADDKRRAAGLLKEFPHLFELEFKRSPYPLIRNKRTGQMVFWVRAVTRGGRNLRGRGTTRKLKKFRVIVDERAFVEDKAIEQAIKPMLATSPGGGQLVEISSPWGKRGTFYADFLKGERCEGRYRSVRLPSSQNPLVDSAWLNEQRQEMTDTAYRTEFEAEFIDTSGAVFREDDLQAAVCEDDYGNAPLWKMRYVAGIDFARRGDWTVVTVLEVGPEALRVVALNRVQGLGYQAQIEQICDVLQNWKVCRVCPDRTGVGDAVCENLWAAMVARGLPCEMDEYVFTGPGKPKLIDDLVLTLSRGRLKFPPHPILLSELRNFEAIPAHSGIGRERLQAITGHDDCVCSLALARRAATPFLTYSGEAAAATVAAVGRLRASVVAASRHRGGTQGNEDQWEFSSVLSPRLPRRRGKSGRCRFWRAALGRQMGRLLASAYRFAPLRRVGAFLGSSTR